MYARRRGAPGAARATGTACPCRSRDRGVAEAVRAREVPNRLSKLRFSAKMMTMFWMSACSAAAGRAARGAAAPHPAVPPPAPAALPPAPAALPPAPAALPPAPARCRRARRAAPGRAAAGRARRAATAGSRARRPDFPRHHRSRRFPFRVSCEQAKPTEAKASTTAFRRRLDMHERYRIGEPPRLTRLLRFRFGSMISMLRARQGASVGRVLSPRPDLGYRFGPRIARASQILGGPLCADPSFALLCSAPCSSSAAPSRRSPKARPAPATAPAAATAAAARRRGAAAARARETAAAARHGAAAAAPAPPAGRREPPARRIRASS